MDVRLIAGSLLLFGVAAFAQENKAQGQPPQPTPAPAPAPEAKPQDPDRPQPTPAQVVEELTKERDRLAREIAYAKDRAKNAKALLAAQLKPHNHAFRAIDAGAPPAPAVPVVSRPPQPRSARLGNPDEFANQPADTIILVNGRPVSRGAYDQLLEFHKASGTTADDSQRAGSSLFELIQIEAVASAFEDNEAIERIAEIEAQVDAGKAIAELAKDVGVVPGTGADGRFETSRQSMFGARFALAAFTTEPGKRARPFRNAHGLVVMQVDKLTKGSDGQLDTVSGTAIQVPYTTEQGLLQKAQLAVNTAQIDIVVKDKEILEALPPMFRRDAEPVMVPGPAQGFDTTQLRTELERLSGELQKLQGKDDSASNAQRQTLTQQYEQAKRMMRMAEAGSGAAQQVDRAEPPKAEPPKEESKKEGPKQEAPKQN